MFIDVVSDLICPWCFIGKRRLDQVLASPAGADVIPRWRPFQLYPQLPMEGLDRATFVGLVAGCSVACVLWWVYFAFTPAVTEHTLRHAATRNRGKVARDLFTFGHFPIVMGILGYAVVVKTMVHDPRAPLPLAERWLLVAAMAVFIGGCLHLQWHVVHRLAPERFVAIAVIAAWLLIFDAVAGWVAVGAIAVVLAVMQAITWHRFRRGALADVAEIR